MATSCRNSAQLVATEKSEAQRVITILLLRSELLPGICRWRKWASYNAAGWARSTFTQPVCCQLQAQCRRAYLLLQPTGTQI